MVVKEGILPGEAGDKLLYHLPFRVAVIGAGAFYRGNAVDGDGVGGFFFPQVDEGADNGEARFVEKGFWQEGGNLTGGKKTHQECFHGVIMMMGIGNLIAARFKGEAVYRAPPEESAGEAAVPAALGGKPSGDVHLPAVVGDIKAAAELPQAVQSRLKVRGKHGVYREGPELKAFFQTGAHGGQSIEKEQAVLPARQAYQNFVPVLNEFKLDDGSHYFAEIKPGQRRKFFRFPAAVIFHGVVLSGGMRIYYSLISGQAIFFSEKIFPGIIL